MSRYSYFIALTLSATMTVEPVYARNYCYQNTPATVVDLSVRTVPERAHSDVRFLNKIKEIGVRTIIRYYSFDDANGHKKTLHRYERDAITQQKLSIAVVFQNYNSGWKKFRNHHVGTLDARRALELAVENSQPRGSAIYFGVDFDPRNGTAPTGSGRIKANLENVNAYFDRVREQFAGRGFRIGVYGSGVVCDELLRTKKVQFCWLSQSHSFPGTQKRIGLRQYDLLQLYPSQDCAGRNLDFNFARRREADFGQFFAYARRIKR